MRGKPHRCRQCGVHEDDCGYISRRGLCKECGDSNKASFNAQMQIKDGPAYNRWVHQWAEGFGYYEAGKEIRAQMEIDATS